MDPQLVFWYRVEKSTEYPLTKLMNFFYSALNNKNFSLGSFINHSKAYNVVDQRISLRKLETNGIWGISSELFKNHLLNRRYNVQVCDSCSNHSVCIIEVLMQGSILGHILSKTHYSLAYQYIPTIFTFRIHLINIKFQLYIAYFLVSSYSMVVII